MYRLHRISSRQQRTLPPTRLLPPTSWSFSLELVAVAPAASSHLTTSMSLLCTTLLLPLLLLLPIALSQFDKPKNANKFVDSVSLIPLSLSSLRRSVLQMIAQVVNASNSTILLADEQFLVVVDLLVFRPELDLQVKTVRPEVGLLHQKCRPLKFSLPSSCSDTLLSLPVSLCPVKITP